MSSLWRTRSLKSYGPCYCIETNIVLICSCPGCMTLGHQSRKRRWDQSQKVHWKPITTSVSCRVLRSLFKNAKRNTKCPAYMSSIQLCVSQGISSEQRKMSLLLVSHATCNRHSRICFDVRQRIRAKSYESWTCGRKTTFSHRMWFSHCLIWPIQTIRYIRILGCQNLQMVRRLVE